MGTLPPLLPATPCENCGAPLHGRYCGECGQPVEGLVRHFSSVMGDVLDSVLNIDSRIVHTLLPLYLRPGKLTLDYLAGKRARYVTPFRLVFFLAILAVFAVQLALHTGAAQVVTYQSPPIAGISISTTPVTGSQDTHFAHGDITWNHRVFWNRQSKPLRIASLPSFVNDWLNDTIENARSKLHDMNSGNAIEAKTAAMRLIGGMFAVAPQVLFVLLPVFALLLKIFYIFKRRLYMEHLIVAMHSHAFIMLSMLLVVGLSTLRTAVEPHAATLGALIEMLHGAAWLWVLVYLFLMQKRVYRQGWLMTTLKFVGIGVCYSVLVATGMALALLISLGSA